MVYFASFHEYTSVQPDGNKKFQLREIEVL